MKKYLVLLLLAVLSSTVAYSAPAGPANTLSVSFGTNGTTDLAARSDHDHFGKIWSGLTAYNGLEF